MIQKASLAVLFVIAVFSASASADQIVLVNGDRLSGTIKSMSNGTVMIATELVGEVSVPLETIQTMSSEKPLEMHLTDDTVLTESVAPAAAGTVKVPGRAENLPLTSVAKINPDKPRWKGDFSTGITYSTGNTNNESYAFSGSLRKRTEIDRTTFDADLYRQKEENDAGDDVVTEDWWQAGAQYDYFLGQKSYVFGQARYEVDKIADLDRRIILGGGYGYQWIETDRTEFSTELGLSCIHEEYEDGQQDDSRLAAQAGYRLRHKFDDTFSLIHDLTYYPSTEKASDYYLTSTGELRAAINDHLFTNFRVLFDYDATPAAGKGSTDVKYILGAGVNF